MSRSEPAHETTIIGPVTFNTIPRDPPQPPLPAPNDHMRRVRLDLCRSADAMVAAIALIVGDEGTKGELRNMVVLTQRMALRLNDGHVSPPERMRSW